MLLQRITDFLLRGRVQAMGTAFALGFIPILGTLSTIIAAFITLRKGIQEGALVLVAATLPVLLIYTNMPVDTQPLDSVNALDVVIMVVTINLLTWLFACVLRKFTSWSWVLQVGGFICVIAVIVLHWHYPQLQNWWQTWLTNYFTTAQQSMKAQDVAAAQHVVTTLVSGIKPYATGFFTAVLCFYAMLELIVARWWQDKIYNPGGLRQELVNIRLSYLMGIVFIVGIISVLMKNASAIDAMPILYMVFTFAGLSLIHYLIARTKKSWLWLLLIYTVLSLVPITAVLVMLVALVDIVLDVRTRIRIKQI